MSNPMTSAYFKLGEQYYTFVYPTLLILIFAMILLFLILIFDPKYRKASRVAVIVAGVLLLGFIGGNHYFARYIELAKDIRPNLRTQQPTILGYKGYPSETITYYKSVQNREPFDALGIYQKEAVTQEVEYLGELEHGYYFRYYDTDSIFYLREKVFFVEDDHPGLKGIQYQLQDPAFLELGFVEETNWFLDGLYILATDKEKQFDTSLFYEARDFKTKQEKWAVLDKVPRRN